MNGDPISACGLFCGACRAFLKGKCAGCLADGKYDWCAVRRCCLEHGWQSCAECTEMPLDACRKFNSFIGKIFGFVFRSDRRGCIERIREVGPEAFAAEMRQAGRYNRPVRPLHEEDGLKC